MVFLLLLIIILITYHFYDNTSVCLLVTLNNLKGTQKKCFIVESEWEVKVKVPYNRGGVCEHGTTSTSSRARKNQSMATVLAISVGLTVSGWSQHLVILSRVSIWERGLRPGLYHLWNSAATFTRDQPQHTVISTLFPNIAEPHEEFWQHLWLIVVFLACYDPPQLLYWGDVEASSSFLPCLGGGVSTAITPPYRLRKEIINVCNQKDCTHKTMDNIINIISLNNIWVNVLRLCDNKHNIWIAKFSWILSFRNCTF